MIAFSSMPMKEAVAFWKDKVSLSPGAFARLTDAAKLKAFGISGIAKGDELATAYEAMLRAVERGTTLADFKRDCAEIFERRGWTGKRAWRVDTIFRTNVQTAYNVGRYRQMARTVSSRPFWQYSAVNDSRTRPTHRALDGKVFPADHAFWDAWYPPNGFRCRCKVVSLSQHEIDRDKLMVETKDPTHGLIEPTDPQTGARLPAVPLIPDRGFSGNPGKSVWGSLVDSTVPAAGSRFTDLPGHSDWQTLGRRKLENMRPADLPPMPARPLPSGLSDAEYLAGFRERYGAETVLTDALGEAVILSERIFVRNKNAAIPAYKFDKPGHGESIPLLREMIERPYEVWLTPQKNEAGRVRLTKRYISAWKGEKDRTDSAGGLAVFEVADGVFLGVSAFLPETGDGTNWRYLNAQRRGLLLYPSKR